MRNCFGTVPHFLYVYVRTLFCVNKYIVPKIISYVLLISIKEITIVCSAGIIYFVSNLS